MPITPNYNWTTPIVNGDFGAWGGILNTAFVEIDADVKALADTVTANNLNVARTNVNNTFSGTQAFAAVTATGDIASFATVTGAQLRAQNTAAVNGVEAVMFRTDTGTDVTLNALYAQLSATPSATGANRVVILQIGDALALRTLALKSNQTYIGQATPAFAGAEQLRVQGSVYVDTTVTASSFIGSGANLTSIPQSAVTSLVSDLAGKSAVGHTHAQSDITGLVAALAAKSDVGHTHAQSDITGLVAALAAKSDVGHVHSGADITSGTIAWARLAAPPRIDFLTGTTQAFQFPTAMQTAAGGVAAPAINRPGAYTAYAWSWINVAPIGSNNETWVPVLSGVNV